MGHHGIDHGRRRGVDRFQQTAQSQIGFRGCQSQVGVQAIDLVDHQNWILQNLNLLYY